MLVLASRGGSKVPYTSARTVFFEALQTLRQKSKEAAKIIDFVEKSPTVQIQVLVAEVAGAFGPYSPEWAFLGPCIVWDAGGVFKTKWAQITGYRPTGSPMYTGKKVDVSYPPEITLLHELGHAKQYIENPAWFGSNGPSGQLAGSKETKEIEADNLKRHENPVCKEYGLLQRVNYGDFEGFDHVDVAVVRSIGR
jgi:hypothetical protein